MNGWAKGERVWTQGLKAHGASGRENIPVAYALDEATARQYARDLNQIGYVIVDESGAVA